jgi:cytochrome c-type biogenesis protein CcmH/NrfF
VRALRADLRAARDNQLVLPIAHAGHWAIWALYLVPVVIVLGSIVVQRRRERRERADAEERAPEPPPE